MDLFYNFINNLIENLDKSKQLKIDLVLDSGGFKGVYLYGALLYLKELEKKKYIIINRISGSSIGAILGAFYILDKLDLFYKNYIKIRSKFKEDLNLNYINTVISNIIEDCDEDDYKLLNNRLFINYYNIETKGEYVINTYSKNNDIIEYLKCTSYIPIITDGELCYNNKVDGNKPYLFNNGRTSETNILYLSLTTIGKLNDYFNTINDINPCNRIMKGIIDIHDFFLYKKTTKMCSYVNKWSITDFTLYRIKEFIWIYILYSITLFDYFYKNIPLSIKNNIFFNQINNIVYKLVKDIYIKLIFT